MLAIILLVNLLRFVGLESSPPGFCIDEVSGATHVLCLGETGQDFWGNRLPLFSAGLNGGYFTAPYLYSEALWTSLFGHSPAAFRSMIAVVACLTILALMALVRLLSQNKRMAMITGLLASIIPWSFIFSRIAWDPPLAPLYLIGALYFLYRPQKYSWVVAAILATLATYSYPPTRIQFALMLFLLPQISWRKKWQTALFIAVACIPLALQYLHPEFLIRSKMVALNSDQLGNPYRNSSFFGLIWAAISQFFGFFNPNFLWGSGDQNVRQSIQKWGEVDWATTIGIFATLIFSMKRNFLEKNRLLLQLGVLGLAAGIIPAALTWESNPHSLRAIGAWPFLVILGAVGWNALMDKNTWARWAFPTIALIFFGLFSYHYFFVYPSISPAWFDVEGNELAKQGRFSNDYPALTRGYFLMTEGQMKCKDLPK